MSFFSTSDLLKGIFTGDLLKQIITSDELVMALRDTLECEHAYELARLIFSHPAARKEVRKIVLDILTEMGIKDEVDSDVSVTSVSSCGTSDDIE